MIANACKDLGFSSLQMTIDDQDFQDAFRTERGHQTWQFSFHLGDGGSLTLTRIVEKDSPALLTRFLEVLQHDFQSRTFEAAPEEIDEPAFLDSAEEPSCAA